MPSDFKTHPLMTKLWTGQAVISYLTLFNVILNLDLDKCFFCALHCALRQYKCVQTISSHYAPDDPPLPWEIPLYVSSLSGVIVNSIKENYFREKLFVLYNRHDV